jgi:triacylglycerol esterase/lipase EstA (alpha/beta hydrolase family)
MAEFLGRDNSMGGLAARAYLQGMASYPPFYSEKYRKDVAKLITIGTPHKADIPRV